MDYGEQDNGASGCIPEFGAIFMSNIQTKKECLKRNVFALPSSHAGFVTRIKAGMVLFLFEFRKRELFGVYQASSDGTMDIVPHAFNYSGQRFPAQVRFRQIWQCDPISEKEFQDAIIENYFSAKKFNFGLSKDQVRRLLYLFSSRKKIPPQPWSEAIKDRRLVGEDRHELSERGYMSPSEYDGHGSSLAREDLVDNRVNDERKAYPFPQDDFLAKKRRIGKEGRLTTNSTAEIGLHSPFYQRTFSTDSPKDSLEEVRTLAHAGRFLTVQMANEDRVNKQRHTVQSSEDFLDPLDVRAHDDNTTMQWSTSPDDCQKTFASDRYGNLVAQSKHVIDDDRFLLDDCVKRDCISNSVNPNSGENLFFSRQAREIVEDQEWLMNRKLENRFNLDCDGTTIRASDPSASLLQNIRKPTAAGRFQIDENEPNYGKCSVEGFSSENAQRPWRCGYRSMEGRKCPMVEGRSTKNMVDKVPPMMAKNAGYFANADRQTLDNARIRKSERIDNQEASHTHTSPIISMRYPSYPQLERNLSSFSDKFPEKQFPQFPTSRNFDISRSSFDDSTITRTVPYLPDYPNLSYGCSVSNEANQNSTSMQKNHPHDGSFGNFYPLSSNRLQQNFLKPEKSSRPLDMTLEFGDNGFATCTSDMDLNTSAPVNYRGSLSSKLSPPCTDLENFEGKRGLLHYYSKSRDHRIAFDGDLPRASENQSKHVSQHGIAMSADKDFSSESKDLGMDIRRPETDSAIHENQYIRFSSNTNPRELHNISGAKSTFNRKSVFTRLSSKESSRFGEERNDIDVNFQDCYMGATADEVMEMLKQDDNMSPRKLRKVKVVGKPRESAVNEKKTQIRMETDHSTMEKKRLNNASQGTSDSMDEIPKETRTLDFKRRSERKKNMVGISAGSASHNYPAGANEEAKSSINSTLRRKKLVRPAFSKSDTAGNATHGNETLQIPAPILDKDDKQSCETATSLLESEIRNDGTAFINGSASQTRQEMMDCNKEPSYPEERKDVVFHVSPSTSIDLKGHEHGNGDLHISSSEVLKETSEQKTFAIQTFVDGVLAKDTDVTTTFINMLASQTCQEMDCNKEPLYPEQQKDAVAHVLPSTSDDLKGHECGNGDISSSEVLKESYQHKIFAIQTSVEGVLANGTDATTTSLNLLEPSLEGFELDAGWRNNVTEDKHLKKMKIILTPKKDVKASSQ